jgi:hypothetical protein
MELLLVILLVLFCIVGLLSIFFGLPGTLIIFASACLYAWLRDFENHSDQRVLIILGILVLLAEGLELLVTVVGSKKAKVPNDVLIASILSGILGAVIGVPIPLLGSILGLFLGIFIGGFLYSVIKVRNWKKAAQLAKAVFLSRMVASVLKAIIGLGMVIFTFMKI